MDQSKKSQRCHVVKLKLVDIENILHNRKRTAVSGLPLPTLKKILITLIENHCLSALCGTDYEKMSKYPRKNNMDWALFNIAESKIDDYKVYKVRGKVKLKIKCNCCGQSFELVHSGLLEKSRVPLIKWLAFINRYCHSYKPCVRVSARELCLDWKTVQKMKDILDAHMKDWVEYNGFFKLTEELWIFMEKSYHWKERWGVRCGYVVIKKKFRLREFKPLIYRKNPLHIFSHTDGNGKILKHMLLRYGRYGRYWEAPNTQNFIFTVCDYKKNQNHDYHYEDFEKAKKDYFTFDERESAIGCCYLIEVLVNEYDGSFYASSKLILAYLPNLLFDGRYLRYSWQYPAEKKAVPKVLPENEIQDLKSALEAYFPGPWKFIPYAKHEISKVKNILEIPDIKISLD